jgi:hypothetical protein
MPESHAELPHRCPARYRQEPRQVGPPFPHSPQDSGGTGEGDPCSLQRTSRTRRRGDRPKLFHGVRDRVSVLVAVVPKRDAASNTSAASPNAHTHGFLNDHPMSRFYRQLRSRGRAARAIQNTQML